MFAACSKDKTEDINVLPDNIQPHDVLQVSVGDEDESRIQLDNGKTVWTQGDKVSVFYKTTGNECWRFNGKTGDRSGTLSKVSGNAGTTNTDKVIALYPYDPNCAISGNMISTTIPTTQTYKANSFGDGGNIMVAINDNNELKFKSIFGWIRLSLTDVLERKVENITFCGNNNEKLAGSVIINSGTQKIYISGNDTSLTLNCGEGVQLSSNVPSNFYIAVTPQTFTAGVSIKVRMTNGTSLKKDYEKSFTITRNNIQPIKASNFQSSNDIILYKTSNNSKIIIKKTDEFGANFISNTYKNGQGKIEFNGDITTIPTGAFSGCDKLTNITIPDSVTSIERSAFSGCSSLTSITIPNGVTSIGDYAFSNCSSLIGITIPDGVTSIGGSAFSDCSRLTNITIPDGIASIGDWAFQNCSSLISITFLGSVDYWGGRVFRGCNNLKGVYIMDIAKWCTMKFNDSESNPLIYAHNLYLNGELLTDLVIPDGVISIEKGTFNSCQNLTSVTIPNSVQAIGDGAFSGCKNLIFFVGKYSSSDLRCLIINGRLINLARFGLTEYTIPSNVTSIGGGAFSGCNNLTSITIPNSVNSIESGAFSNCSSLTSITIPDGVTSIEYSTFYGCSNLTKITIPYSVTKIRWRAFYNCNNLNNIYCKSIIPPSLELEVFKYIPIFANIYVPRNSVDAYKSATNWSDYASKIKGYDF